MTTMPSTYRPQGGLPRDIVRLLLSDVSAPWVFADAELDQLLRLEGGNVKRATAQAIDSNATSEALASKVLKDHAVSTDGAKLADAMRRHAAALRDQADSDDAAGDGFHFGVTDIVGTSRPELTGSPYFGSW